VGGKLNGHVSRAGRGHPQRRRHDPALSLPNSHFDVGKSLQLAVGLELHPHSNSGVAVLLHSDADSQLLRLLFGTIHYSVIRETATRDSEEHQTENQEGEFCFHNSTTRNSKTS